MLRTTFYVAAIAALVTAGAAVAQQPPIKRTPLQKFDVPDTKYETVVGMADIAPNIDIGRHTHPGPESGYLLAGDFVLLIDGQPPQPLKAGDSYKIPSGAVHTAKAGAAGAKVLAVYVVEKGKPLASPAK